MTEQPPTEKKCSKRIYVLWGVALLLLVTLALACYFFLVPALRARSVLAWEYTPAEAVRRLGGPRSAGRRIRLFLILPRQPKNMRSRAASLLLCCGRYGIPGLRALLRDGHSANRRDAAMSLGCLGPVAWPAVPALRDALQDSEAQVRIKAARALGWIGPAGKPAAAGLAGMLSSGSHSERDEAAKALIAIGPAPEAVPGIISALEDQSPDVRLVAARALAAQGPLAASAAPTIERLVESARNKWEGNEYRWALANIVPDPERSVALLAKLLDAKPVEAAKALGAKGPSAKAAVPQLIASAKIDWGRFDMGCPDEALRALVLIAPKSHVVHQTLREVHFTTNVGAQAYAAAAYFRLTGKPGLVARMLKSEDSDLRFWGAYEAAKLGPRGKSLLPLLKSLPPDPDLNAGAQRASAILAISPGDEPSRKLLRQMLLSSNPEQQVYAAGALDNLGPRANGFVPDLAALLESNNEVVKECAARTLGEIGPAAKDAVGALENCTRRSFSEEHTVYEALLKIRDAPFAGEGKTSVNE